MEYPGNVMAKSELARAIGRLAEQEKGGYQFKKLYVEATQLRPPQLDHATYIGPVSVRTSGSRGRGLFTKEAVKAGDLLLCEKAFALAFADPEKPEDVTIRINTETDSATMGAQTELISMIVQKLYRNPSLASVFTELHHGSYEPVGVSVVDDTPVVDT
jgi:hypothetical protein